MMAGVANASAGKERSDATFFLGLAALVVVTLWIVPIPAVPLVLDQRSLYSRSSEVSILPTFVAAIVPFPVIIGLGLGVLIARGLHRLTFHRPSIPRPVLVMMMTWAVAAPVALLGLTMFTEIRATFPRYFLVGVPAVVLLTAWVIAYVEPERSRRIIPVSVIAVSIVAAMNQGLWRHSGEDWRTAVGIVNRFADRDSPVLVETALFQAKSSEWLLNPIRASYLTAPVSYYPIVGHVHPVPLSPSDGGDRYLTEVLESLTKSKRFFLITRGSPAILAWLEEELRGRYRAERLDNMEFPAVFRFVSLSQP